MCRASGKTRQTTRYNHARRPAPRAGNVTSVAGQPMEGRPLFPLPNPRQDWRGRSQFVHEELQFARGCLAFARGDLKTARKLIEPLASNGEVAIRSHVLGRLYEAQGLWPEAAAQYDGVFGRPNTLAAGWPALWSLDRFRLAQLYERLGDKARARQLYERFAADWKDGDPDIAELVTARQRLALLGSRSTPSVSQSLQQIISPLTPQSQPSLWARCSDSSGTGSRSRISSSGSSDA
jgi:tetratricopeptide (TPR) repeat protein